MDFIRKNVSPFRVQIGAVHCERGEDEELSRPQLTHVLIFPFPQMRLKLNNKDLYVTREGTEELPTVAFLQINPFKLWIWVNFYQVGTCTASISDKLLNC